MRTRSAAIVIHEGKLLVLHRLRHDEEYYTFPGGGVDDGEDFGVAAVRELEEETTVIGKVKKFLYHNIFINPHTRMEEMDQHFFLCDYVSGKPQAGNGEEYIKMTKENWYEPMWVDLQKLPEITLYPTGIRDAIIEDFPNNFSEAPREIE